MATDKATTDVITKREKSKQDRTNRNLGTYTSEAFKAACSSAGVTPSARQASKFNNGYGAAYRASK